MKKIITAVIAAVAFMTFASCQKMDSANKSSEPEKTVRVITGEFSNDGTKTTLDTDGKTPKWSVGDVIRVLNETSYQDITLTSANIDSQKPSKITFETTLSGMLYAVYPASATAMTSCSDGNITFIIPAVQDGTFGSANICVASGDGEKANSIFFSNATAVVEMTVKSGVVYANLAAANNIAGNMTVAVGNKGKIGTTTPSLSSKSIFVTGTPSNDKFYMAVAPGATGAVTITCNTSSKSGSANRSTKTLVMNKIYAITLSGMTIDADSDLTGQKSVQNGQEFVLIKAKYNGNDTTYLKWATQNLAVTASGKAKWMSTNYQIGDYFQWAAYDGYVSGTKPGNLVIYTSFTNDGSEGSFSDWKDSKLFDNASAPYYNEGEASYSKYTSTDSKTVLEPSDDVASIVLGGTWRMPTGGSAGEFNAMRAVTYWAWDDTDMGYYVFKPGVGTKGSANENGTLEDNDDKTKALLFFPAAGYGDSDGLEGVGFGFYWSSTLYSDYYAANVCGLMFDSSSVDLEAIFNRYYGISVRPVSE